MARVVGGDLGSDAGDGFYVALDFAGVDGGLHDGGSGEVVIDLYHAIGVGAGD